MATLSADKTYVTVQKGDTLWGIASTYLGAGSKYTQLAAINDLPNPDLIYVGQKIYLSKQTSTTTKKPDAQRATIKQFGLQSDTDNELFATWSWSKTGDTENYQINWQYKTAVGIWFVGVDSTTKYLYSTYTIPDRAKQVRFRIKPVAKTVKNNSTGAETAKFSATWSEWKTYDVETKPDVPTGLSVSIDGLKLTAKIDNLASEITLVKFEVVKDNLTTFKTGTAKVSTASVSYSCDIEAGGEYKVRCAAGSYGVYSDWTGYSNTFKTIPATVSELTSVTAKSESSICVEWASANGATEYEMEYTKTKTDFDEVGKASSITGITTTKYTITGLESGNEYFFRVRAKNAQGTSDWSTIKSTTIGTGPISPTTWSSTTTAVAGENESVTLYWVHNSEDGSSQTYAELELYFNGVDDIAAIKDDVSVEIGTIRADPVVDTVNKVIIYTIDNSTKESEKDKTHSFTIKTAKYSEGAEIKWRVRTAGITNTQGEWSIQRKIDIYNKPALTLSVTDSNGNALSTFTSFPFNVRAVVGALNTSIQRPIGYHLQITSNEVYETVDNIGNDKLVNAGEAIYAKHFDHPYENLEPLEVTLSAGDLTLENGVEYTLTCTVFMSSGLTAEATTEFDVAWESVSYVPNAEIGVNTDNYSAFIRPYCSTHNTVNRKVTRSLNQYTLTTEVIDHVYGTPMEYTITTTGETVYSGVDADGNNVFYAVVEEETIFTNVTLAVYRREFDGSFTEIASNLDGSLNTFVTDPHPSLDYARYRIVAIDNDTSLITYYDMPGYYVGGKSVIIQWDEEWSQFDSTGDEGELDQPPWSGSFLVLPYNIDVSDRHIADVALVEYIGRKHPVSYYGTQLGETSTWNVVIDKSDKETLYALRRLAVWTGDVYIREPSGSGYHANIGISFSQKHRELTIPVTIDITRVEGGM